MKYLGLLLLFFSFNASAQNAGAFGYADSLWHIAGVYRDTGDYETAIKYYDLLLDKTPFFVDGEMVLKGHLYFALSECTFATGDTVTGCRYLAEGVKEGHFMSRLRYPRWCGKNPATDTAYIVRGMSWGVHDQAVADFDTALMLNPTNAWAYYQRGGQWVEAQKYEAAIADFDKVIALQPDDYHGYYLKGMVRFKQADFNDAAACFTVAMHKDTTYKKLHFYRGVSFYNLKEYKKALNDFAIWEQQPEVSGKSLGGIYNLHATCLAELKEQQQACEYFNKAIALGYQVGKEEMEKCGH